MGPVGIRPLGLPSFPGGELASAMATTIKNQKCCSCLVDRVRAGCRYERCICRRHHSVPFVFNAVHLADVESASSSGWLTSPLSIACGPSAIRSIHPLWPLTWRPGRFPRLTCPVGLRPPLSAIHSSQFPPDRAFPIPSVQALLWHWRCGDFSKKLL